jgi:hypothetical protein
MGARAAAMLFPLLLLPLATAASAATNEGGSHQVGAQSGCMNKWMFDGTLNAWEVTMQWGNGTAIANLKPTDSLKQDLVIALKNGDTMSAGDTTSGTLDEQKLDYHAFPASGQFTFTQPFRSATALDEANPPAKLLITFDVAKYRSYHPGGSGQLWRQKTVSPNFRIDLTCGA